MIDISAGFAKFVMELVKWGIIIGVGLFLWIKFIWPAIILS